MSCGFRLGGGGGLILVGNWPRAPLARVERSSPDSRYSHALARLGCWRVSSVLSSSPSPWGCATDAVEQAETDNRKHSSADLFLATQTDDFTARSSDELTLAKGDRVQLIERDDEFGDGWFLGKHMVNGNSGLFPEGTSAFEVAPSSDSPGPGGRVVSKIAYPPAWASTISTASSTPPHRIVKSTAAPRLCCSLDCLPPKFCS